ncbi:MAG: hypothetical protein Q7S55_05265 [Nanoarchaeota archaeon]|nr:hypothetical protein [Nanoarchaeota archaeon]
MLLKTIARDFAHQHKIELNTRRNSLIGRKGRLVVGYLENSLRQKVFVNKSFPPLDGIYESRIIIDDDGQNPVLKMNILYGCLEDYITQLHKVKTDLCKDIHGILIDSYLDLEKYPQLPENILQEQLPISIPDHVEDLHELLWSFYPYKR